MVTFGRDLIAEKNKRERMKSSIIKCWNVNYINPAEQHQEEEEKLKETQVQEVLHGKNKDYNVTTGSFSGTYGQGQVDDVTQDQVAMILNEKNAALQGIIDSRKKD